MKTVLLKNVPEDAWISFKTEAITHDMNMGAFLAYLIKEHSKTAHAADRLKRILSYRSGRSTDEIKKHEEFIARFRKEFTLKR